MRERINVTAAASEAVFTSDKRPELADRDASPASRDGLWTNAVKQSLIKAVPQTPREWAEPAERTLSQVRGVVEHPFSIRKNAFRDKKLRCRGLRKNTAQPHTLFAPANLVIVKRALLVPSWPGSARSMPQSWDGTEKPAPNPRISSETMGGGVAILVNYPSAIILRARSTRSLIP